MLVGIGLIAYHIPKITILWLYYLAINNCIIEIWPRYICGNLLFHISLTRTEGNFDHSIKAAIFPKVVTKKKAKEHKEPVLKDLRTSQLKNQKNE